MSITLELTDMAHGGDAVGRYDGRAVFVPLGIPGETVRVCVEHEHKRFANARLLEVVEPSPDRVTPPCRYFGLCGGCQWQHIAYEAQLRFKEGIVRNQLQRLGGQYETLVRPVIGMDEPWGYRNHVQLTMDRRGQLGYQALKRHDVVPVDACYITHPYLDELWDALDLDLDLSRVSLRCGAATGERLILFEGRDDDLPILELDAPVSCLFQAADGRMVVLAGDAHYCERLRDILFQVSGPSFFQVNTGQAERVLDVVEGYLALDSQETLLDVYCGVGTFALTLARTARHVIGVEASPWAIHDAVANADRADFANVELYEGLAEEVLPSLDVAPDAVVVDPPRAGCAPEALSAIARSGPSRIVYVSCDPATLARDVASLADMGYRLMEAQPIDMFPHTYHIETVAKLVRDGR